jgi:hypothetical protein
MVHGAGRETVQAHESEGSVNMRKSLFHFVLLSIFVVMGVRDGTVYLHAPSEYTNGTDSACERFHKDLEPYKKAYKRIVFTNNSWIPSPKIIINR